MRGLVNLSGRSGSEPAKASPEHVGALKNVVVSALGLDPDTAVLVQQLACAEPGCPPVETVVAVLSSPRRTWKIPSPTAEVAVSDLCALLTNHPEGLGHDHDN